MAEPLGRTPMMQFAVDCVDSPSISTRKRRRGEQDPDVVGGDAAGDLQLPGGIRRPDADPARVIDVYGRDARRVRGGFS